MTEFPHGMHQTRVLLLGQCVWLGVKVEAACAPLPVLVTCVKVELICGIWRSTRVLG